MSVVLVCVLVCGCNTANKLCKNDARACCGSVVFVVSVEPVALAVPDVSLVALEVELALALSCARACLIAEINLPPPRATRVPSLSPSASRDDELIEDTPEDWDIEETLVLPLIDEIDIQFPYRNNV